MSGGSPDLEVTEVNTTVKMSFSWIGNKRTVRPPKAQIAELTRWVTTSNSRTTLL